MIGLDTSVVVRLLIGEPADQAHAARELLAGGSGAVVSDLVVGESYFALRHHYGVPHRRAVSALIALIDGARVQARGVALEVLRAAASASEPGLMDRLIHADYDAMGVALHTFDRGAARLKGSVLVR